MMQTVFSEALLARLRAQNSAAEEFRDDTFQDPDDREDPDDLTPRLVVERAEPNVEKIYSLPALPAPLPSEMPSSFWTPLLLGKPDDAINLEDAHLCLALIEARLAEGRDSGQAIKRDPGPTVSVANALPATVGALHERIYERYDSRGWFAFQRLFHEAAGLHPKRPRTVAATNVMPNGDAMPAAPVDCSAIEPGLVEAISQMPTKLQC
jgi:hypothetical protein